MTQRRQPPPRGAAPRRVGPPSSAPRRPVKARPVQGRAPQRPVQRRTAPPRRQPRPLRLGRPDRRVRVGFLAVCLLLLVIGGRLVQLQGIDHADYSAAASAQRLSHLTVQALRGSVLDRNGTPLAYTTDAQDITADPKQVHTAVTAHRLPGTTSYSYALYLDKLAPLLDVPAAKLLGGLTGKGEYAMLAQALAPATAQRVLALHLPGIYTQATTQRQYPGGTTAANIIGTVHSDGAGAAGIESELNALLAGKNGSQTYTVDSSGNVNPSSSTVATAARNGATVRLTIDQDLQYKAQQLLQTDVPASGARGGQIAVLDAHTGQALALASYGTFDAADPDTINPDEPINPTVMSAFEPGSVQKAITFAAALQEHKITPQQTMQVADKIREGGVTINDAWIHSTQPFTMTGILAQSSNVGTLKVANLLGPTVWDRYEKLFGVGTATGIQLPGESSGYLPPLSTWSASTFANLPFGQGESMTILQLASIYQAIANNGVRVPPRIISSITKPGGSTDVPAQPAGVRVISPSVASTLRTMLESVTLPGGTGVKAALPGYRVAGKTGTAQQPDPAHGGAYSSYKNWDTFAGMVPADNPKFVVAIMVDNPAHGVEGGDVAAPLFNKIAGYETQHAQVPPTGSKSRYVPLEDCKGLNPAYLPAHVCSD